MEVYEKYLKNWKERVASNNSTFDIINPALGEVITSLPEMGKIETVNAIDKLEQGFSAWSSSTFAQRASLLLKWAEIIEENKNEIATLLTIEQGKPLSQAQGEVSWAISLIRKYANVAENTHGYTPIQSNHYSETMITKQPIGIIGIITPWNFPVGISVSNIAGSISVGNVALCKTSEETPLSVAVVIEMAYQAGIPDNVIQYLTAGNPQHIGDAICADYRVRMLSFTGSTATGKKLYEKSASNVKKLLLELGGNSPFIVYDDANIDKAVNDAAILKFKNCGQVCVNANRFFIHERVYDQFVEKLTKKAKEQITGNGLDPKTTMGPLINKKGLEKVQSLVKNAIKGGAALMCGGSLLREDSLFYAPTVLANVSDTMDLFCHEIFGPVAACYKFSSENEVLNMANDTEYGLAAYCYTENLSRAFTFSKNIQSGNVAINSIEFNGGPFGGFKQSGVGRSGGHINPLEVFCETKTINIKF
ncbi:NAD-dependent succinate-semialdehyde dehydrogenase [Cysteiniphilum halobium]|uniref:NAD-dependent succinate-semialdehyde dehydrogenase n=1 Tax=Cysteiniphilum halobium TaxID=2219059 RepID=UPI000E64BC6E|nr:NAD-dependent succinate-semialdehyde dehydrogenase [Cysteiniphilum halobium]